jgi:hypothetical protein
MSLFAKMLHVEIQKQKCLDAFRHPVEEVEETPFPSFQPLGWFETLVRQALKKIPTDSAKWPGIASIYTAVTGDSFSNYVLGFLSKGPDPDLIPIDTFAYVMRYWKTKRVFLIEGLDAISPVELGLQMILCVPSIPLWKAILRQYQFLEQDTGTLFLSLTTGDAAEYYVRTWFPEEPYVEEFKGALSEKPFVLGTYNFKQLLDDIVIG